MLFPANFAGETDHSVIILSTQVARLAHAMEQITQKMDKLILFIGVLSSLL